MEDEIVDSISENEVIDDENILDIINNLYEKNLISETTEGTNEK